MSEWYEKDEPHERRIPREPHLKESHPMSKTKNHGQAQHELGKLFARIVTGRCLLCGYKPPRHHRDCDDHPKRRSLEIPC